MRTLSAEAPPLFAADVAGEDSLGRAPAARLLADLAAHPSAGTPLLIAIHGSPGSGKSSFLGQIVDRLQETAASASAPPRVVARIDASAGADAAAGLVSGLYAALKPAYPDLADDAFHAGGDPLATARVAGDRVAELRRQLDAERQSLDDIGGRQVRLADTVLFETPGARVDSYARANRGRIEGRLRAFGLSVADPILTYKDLVRETAERDGGGSRLGMTLRALWGYKGQGTLIVLAILLLLLGWASAYLADNQDLWVAWLNGLGDKFAGLSGWAQDHAGWLAPMSHAAYALAALAVLVDILRAFRFMHPVMRGASFLKADIEARRRDLDGLLAHQTRRVDHLAGEIDAAARAAEAAERRVEARRAAGLIEAPSFPTGGRTGPAASPHAASEAFLSTLRAGRGRGEAGPDRIVVVIDDLDRLPRAAAAGYLDTVHRLLARPGFVTLLAVDRPHVLDGFSETDPAHAAARLGRCVQLSYDLDAEAAASARLGPPAPVEGALDRPWQGHEGRLLREMAAFAGHNPRAMKRFVNAYRLARADPGMADARPAETAGLALALALDESGAAAELGAYEAGDGRDLTGRAAQSDLGAVVAAAQAAIGERFTPAEARRGLLVARIYSRRG